MVEKWTRERRRQQTRDSLLEAAAEVFARRGFEGASLDEIAATAGFTRGAIYKNFGNKDELFLALFDREIEQNLAVFADRFTADPAAAVDVGRLSDLWGGVMLGAGTGAYALFGEFRLYAVRNPEVRERFAAHNRKTREAVAQFIEWLAENSGVPLRASAWDIAGWTMAASDGFVQWAYVNPEDSGMWGTFLATLLPALVDVDAAPATPASKRASQAVSPKKSATPRTRRSPPDRQPRSTAR